MNRQERIDDKEKQPKYLQSRHNIIFYILGITAFFTLYEFLKTIFLPNITVWRSHILSIVVVCLLSTIFFLWFRKIYSQQNQVIKSINQHLTHKIAEHKLTENALKESEYLLSASQRMAHIGTCVIDFTTNTWKGTLEINDIFGIDETYPHTIEGLLGIVHPDWHEKISANYHKAKTEGNSFDIDFKIKRIKDNKKRWVSGFGEIEYDPQKVPVRLVVTIQDITLRREAEDHLRIWQRAVEQSPVSIVITNLAGNIEYVNQKATETTGYTREELIGKNPRVLKSGETSDEEYEELWANISNGNEWKMNFHNKRKNGELYWELSHMVPIIDVRGKITHYLAIKEDITETKRIREELVLSDRRFSQVAAHSRTVVWEVDEKGMVKYVNSVAQSVYGYSPDELIGKKYFYDLYPEDVRQKLKNEWFEIFEREPTVSRMETPVKKKDGNLIWVSKNGSAIMDDNQKIIGYRGSDKDITERKLAEDELRNFRTISDQANYGTAITTLDDVLIYVNDAWARMYGWDKEALVGQKRSVLYSIEQTERIRTLQKKVQSQGGFAAEEVWNLRKNGSIFPTIMSAKTIVDSNGLPQFISSTVIDITEIKNKETELRKLTIAIEQSPVAMVITDLDGNIQYASPALEKITGYKADEVLGQNTRVLKSGQTSKHTYKQFWETIKVGNVWKGEWINKKKNGDLYWESISVTPIFDEKGEMTSYLAIKEDITKQKQAEQDRIARTAAEEANWAKSAFLSNMSHEIRTPLNAIIGFAQILNRDSSLASKQTEQVQTILRSGEHLMKLINNILDLSKIESGHLSTKEVDFSVQDLLKDIQMMFHLQTKDKGLEFLVEIQGTVSKYVTADEAKLRQVLINLLGNAVKFTKTGGIYLRIMSDANVEYNQGNFQNGKDGFCLVVEVEDTGIGISKEDMELIFDSFYQAQAGQMIGGTGLGLVISKNLIELMGGKLTLESELGKGTTFRFFVPMKFSNKKEEKQERMMKNVVGIEPGTGPFRILVVDDSNDNRLILSELLKSVGFEIKQAVNGQEALEVFEQWNPHTVLMDLHMPVMDGYEATRRIRAMEKGRSVFIISMTAHVLDSDKEEVLAAGMDAFLSKPFCVEELFILLGKLLGLRYVFDDNIDQTTSLIETRPLTREDMAILPKDLLRSMGQAVEQGNMVKFRKLIPQVEKVNAHAANELQSLAKKYDYEKLTTLLSE